MTNRKQLFTVFHCTAKQKWTVHSAPECIVAETVHTDDLQLVLDLNWDTEWQQEALGERCRGLRQLQQYSTQGCKLKIQIFTCSAGGNSLSH